MIPADRNPPFVLAGQLKMVLTVLVPAAVYAGAIGWIGIYVASILFIASSCAGWASIRVVEVAA
jgi:hypothetical protein